MTSTMDLRQGRLVLLGSGETAPTMVEVHRSVLAAAGPGSALILDTSYGFQENADAITTKAVNYFQESVGRTLTPVRWRHRLEGVALDRALTAVRRARAVYAGPGSPSYAVRVWRDSGFTEAVRAMVAAGGTATFSSAAAIALGVVAMPTHEIYRCGEDPHWLPGTDLLGELTGISAAVIPHYNLAPKNGTHDTRCCYIGERRMRQLERQLPPGAHVIGIDEHTALIIDLATRTARVFGRGSVTVRVDGQIQILPAQAMIPLDILDPVSTARPDQPTPVAAETQTAASGTIPVHDGAAKAAYVEFTSALRTRDADLAGSIALRLEQSVAQAASGWPESVGEARRTLRGMVLELAQAATDGLADPRAQLEPLVAALLEQRAAARERRDFTTADLIRNRLTDAGIEVRDSATGVRWSLLEPSRTPLATPQPLVDAPRH